MFEEKIMDIGEDVKPLNSSDTKVSFFPYFLYVVHVLRDFIEIY
jgi:hypothetical protein